ncbi:DUF6491 family protein [Caulobacter sp. 17J80-11]|uniref:DUF6491 family protein n=1 Tax=Caulobacter sp. 17J80-11 TaxID=2763502 RepID=UPI001653D209|nr:DUF6491 family protein [Caulobacter sp. 17J80-11]MBC6980124.1 hypothetical protein [Caulobacter sp. 17J80-11]
MRHKLLVLTAALGALVATACAADGAKPASAEAKPKRACFHTDQVRNFSADGEDKVYVRTGAKDVFELQMLGRCPNVDWSQRLGLRARGGSFVCEGIDLDLIVPQQGMGPDVCPVRAMRKLTEDEIKALKDKP